MDNHSKGKVIVVSAPSGCGKSTIINSLLDRGDIDMQFSVSATNRAPRQGETEGESYYFMTTSEFRAAVDRGEFVEWEEVYPGRFYGTLRSEIERIIDAGHNVILDVDVKGGVNVKRMMGNRAVSIFIMPPSVEVLRSRLLSRGTDTPEAIEERVGKAEYELSFAPKFDHTVTNDELSEAIERTRSIITGFID